MLGQRLALVHGARDPRREDVHERGQRLRLAELGLAVADPDLHGREREMRAHAPPELRVLCDRARVIEEADIPLVLLPAAERIRDPAARERPREDLCPRRVEVRVDAFDER